MSGSDGGVYVESTIIMTTVRAVAPFVFTFGLFVMFHGAESAGGGFQGGALVAAAVLLLAFTFGIESTRAWLASALVRTAIVELGIGAVVSGVLVGLFFSLAGGDFELAPGGDTDAETGGEEP